jgi:hypothetical protein
LGVTGKRKREGEGGRWNLTENYCGTMKGKDRLGDIRISS